MKIYEEKSLQDWEPVGGAVNAYERIKEAGKLEELEEVLMKLYPNGIDDIFLNDLLWFESDRVYKELGIK